MSRASAYILCGMPFFLAAVLTALRPNYLGPLFTDPRGPVLIVVALVAMVVGALVLRKIVSVRMA
jgi:tight adherence protein B